MEIKTLSPEIAARNKNQSILLLHGLGVYGESWWHQIQVLSENGFFPLAPDLPGFGLTPAEGKVWTVKGAAESAIKVLDEHDLGKTVVCGLSMGGAIALQITIDFPERIAGLILINTFSALRPSSFSEAFYFMRRGLRAYLRSPGDQAELVANRIFPHQEHAEWRARLVDSIRASDSKIYKQAMLALARFNANKYLEKINVPTMVITSACDSTIPPRVQERMANKIPRVEHHRIEGAGHGVIVDHYEQVNRLMLDFLRRVYSS